jgi:hypothetical protein
MFCNILEEPAISVIRVEETLVTIHQTTWHNPAECNFEPTRHCGIVTKKTTIQTFVTMQTFKLHKDKCNRNLPKEAVYMNRYAAHSSSNSNINCLHINPLPALTYHNILDLNVACRAKRTQMYWHVHKFKCPLKKTQPSCPCSRDLNWTGKGLILPAKSVT